MKRDIEFLQYVTDELLADVPNITTRPMFSGFAVYKDGIVFALILGSQLYFKTDETNRSAFISRGSEPFSFAKSGKEIVTAYYELPEEIREDREALMEWIEKSRAVSRRKKAS